MVDVVIGLKEREEETEFEDTWEDCETDNLERVRKEEEDEEGDGDGDEDNKEEETVEGDLTVASGLAAFSIVGEAISLTLLINLSYFSFNAKGSTFATS